MSAHLSALSLLIFLFSCLTSHLSSHSPPPSTLPYCNSPCLPFSVEGVGEVQLGLLQTV